MDYSNWVYFWGRGVCFGEEWDGRNDNKDIKDGKRKYNANGFA